MEYLSFEKPIEELENQLKALDLASETGVDMANPLMTSVKNWSIRKRDFENLSAEKVQLSRHPQDLYTGLY